MITAQSSLVDVAFEVCTALHECGTQCVLTGGSAATFYTDAYRSHDIDFIATPGRGGREFQHALENLGFYPLGDRYAHRQTAYTVDFPSGPLSVGTDLLKRWETVRRRNLVLHVLTRTDAVRDRLAGFFYWNDRGNLRTAVLIALSGSVDYDLIREWSFRENAAAKFEEFIKALERSR